ncbi:hypothetical protein LCGC14_1637650 [marine sediment metagenome]|uniref:Uncharacterized protein n=1 Tax=marine sediment metagenome TaxID=412755 RepID=A0A0F9L037_9ZZZZ
MATLSVRNPTLLDLAKASDPDGKIATIVEILNETNEILEDMTWIEGNLPTGHRTTIRSGLPAPTWRKLYGGVCRLLIIQVCWKRMLRLIRPLRTLTVILLRSVSLRIALILRA